MTAGEAAQVKTNMKVVYSIISGSEGLIGEKETTGYVLAAA